MAFCKIEKNNVVDGGSYTFGVHKFTRVERNSARTGKKTLGPTFTPVTLQIQYVRILEQKKS